MGGQETLLLVARHPDLLAGAAAMDSVTDLARRYRQLPELPCERRLPPSAGTAVGLHPAGRLAREVGGTPAESRPARTRAQPDRARARIAASGVPLQIWWSRTTGSSPTRRISRGALFRAIRRLGPLRPRRSSATGGTRMRWGRRAPADRAAGFGLLPAATALPRSVAVTKSTPVTT